VSLSFSFFLQLIGGLSDEKGRWLESVEYLEKTLSKILGDVLISAGCIAYLGSFTV
jgi:dynein heavy chain